MPAFTQVLYIYRHESYSWGLLLCEHFLHAHYDYYPRREPSVSQNLMGKTPILVFIEKS